MAKKENIESGEHRPIESPAVADTKSKRNKSKKDLDSEKVVKDNSESKSLDIQETSSLDDQPQTSETEPAPENSTEINPSEPLNKDAAETSDEGASDKDHTKDGQPQAADAEMDPENEEINSTAAEEVEPLADQEEIAPENTEHSEGEADTEKDKPEQGPEAQKADNDAVDKNQASTEEQTIPEAIPKTDAQENGDIPEDGAHPPQPEDQETGQEEASADDAVEGRSPEGAPADDDKTDPSAPGDQETTTDAAAPDDDTEGDLSETDSQKKSVLKIAVSVILIVAVFSGFFIFNNKSKVKGTKTNKAPASQNQVRPARTHRKEIVDIQPSLIPSRYDRQIDELRALRDTLLKKQAEILALKQSYQSGIDELEKEIFDEQRKTGLQTFRQATENKRILFRLKTIQRRQAYIRQLEVPYAWVSEACEKLLYLKRRVKMDLQVSEVASGIDMNRHARQMQAAIQKYQPTADKLAVDPLHAQLEALGTIWQRIQSKKSQYSAGKAQSRNQIISDQICMGNFNRLSELSEISVETAKCLIQLKASDLFLNRLTEISPGSARQLCQWKGEWMCLNAIKALSPRVAHYLFQWDGTWISLNGLTEFPAEIGEVLLNWEGKQLELMGLRYTGDADARIALEYLAQWEQSGGKLFVPQNLRSKLDALHRQPG